MRTLALLLLLLNIGFLIWQLGLLPWLPWQAEQFKPINQPNSFSETSNLPQLLLIGESNAKTEAKKIQNSVEDTTSKPKEGENIAYKKETTAPKKESAIKPLTEKPAESPPKNTTIVSTLKQIAGLSTSTTNNSSNNSSPEKKLKEEEVTSASTKPVAKKSPKPETSVCFQAGPYSHINTPKKIANWLKKNENIIVEVQNRQTQVVKSTWVYLPPFQGKLAANRTQQRLNQLGITDHAIVTKGQFNNAISLGLYRSPLYAKKRIKQLVAKGFKNVKTQKRYKNETTYWLGIKMSTEQSQLLKNTLKKRLKGHQLKLCDSIALKK